MKYIIVAFLILFAGCTTREDIFKDVELPRAIMEREEVRGWACPQCGYTNRGKEQHLCDGCCYRR